MGASETGFVYTDLDGSNCVETGGELFGDSRRIGDGDLANHGFEALATYDSDFDGRIAASDMNWPDLRLWVDRSHDGQCTPEETSSLGAAGVVAIDLDYERSGFVDSHGNEFRYFSYGWCRTSTGRVVRRVVYDVFFLTSGDD
jgi:hypothetical protein